MESPYSRKKRLHRERQQRYCARQDQQKFRQKKQASKAAQRLRKTPEQTEVLRQRNAEAHSSRRIHETMEERQERQLSDAAAHAARRKEESDEHARCRRKHDAAVHSVRRSNETTEQAQMRRNRQTAYRNAAINQQRASVQEQAEVGVQRHDCGPMNCICQFCGSKNFVKELPADKKFNSCCHKGKVMLPKSVDIDGNVLQYPNFLVSLLTDPSNPHHKEFRKHIRSYNSLMSFASMGGQIAEPPGSGPYVFRIHGTVHHRTTHLNPPDGVSRKFAQLYVVDSTQAVEQRMEETANEGCSRQVVDAIDRFLREHNRLVASYQMIREIEERERVTAERDNRSVPVVNMVLRRDRQNDQRRFNMPTCNEIAMVFVNDDGEPPFERDIRIYPKNPTNEAQQFVNINILSPNLDPMTYVIMYPYGQPGWQPKWQCNSYPGALQRSRTNVSMLQFKVAQTAIRNEFNAVISAGKLTQQWIVDSYLQVEANNLNFVRYKQNKLRAELYQGLADHVADVAEGAGVQAGTPIILPSSFEGSPRNMRERLQDAMSIFGRYGPPDLFITFTANPNWDEIRNNLRSFENACDRPDLVARVFRLKLKALIEDVTVNHVLGKCIAHAYTIEFQKRGLPHAHILVVLEDDDKFRTSERIDSVVCAEIPDREQDTVLFEVVTSFMIHGPCGSTRPSAPCMENGECTKQFPKQLQVDTVTNANGYPLYRRRDVSVMFGNRELDNRYVVPYNRYLLLKFNAHINTEVCTSLKAIKYIYKYVYKGFDCANVVLGSGDNRTMIHDEIATFINARYVSAPEAMWRLLEFPMHDRSHAVIRLPVHLPNQQQIVFEEGNEQEALDQAATRSTKLLAWFKLNREDSGANQYLYTEIPHHYIFQHATWKRRQRGTRIVARMYTVGLQDIERFSLRLLLLHVPGALSFEHLRTVNEVEYSTFKEAAFHLNLLSSDEEWEKCLAEAAVFLMPPQLRQTFALICVFCFPTNALFLWEKFAAQMCLDFARQHDERTAINLALQELKDMLCQHGLSCSSFGLPEPTGNVTTVEYINTEEESHEAERLISTLNDRQLDAFRKIVSGVDHSGTHKLFYLNGPGGSGKTYLYNTLISFIRSRGQTVLAYATTGIAATLIKGGQTIHRGFKLPVPVTETSVSKILQGSKDAEELKKAALIIMDEITMLSKHGLRCIDLILRELMACSVPFGGKVIVIGGDWRQTLPVVPNGKRIDVVEVCLKSSPLWSCFETLSLESNMRNAGDADFNQWLLDIGTGNVPQIGGIPHDAVQIPSTMVEQVNLIETVFETNINRLTSAELSKRVILAPTNRDILQINRTIIDHQEGTAKIYYSTDSIQSEDVNDVNAYPVEYLYTLTPSGVPPHVLCLKPGTIVMLLRNLNPRKGLCNGTRMVVRTLHEAFITCEIISESHRGDVVCIPRINFSPSDSNYPFILKRRQYPVIPAFAMTINKAQGQTFERVGIFLSSPVFSHGQLYVALSRSKHPEFIKVYISKTEGQGCNDNDVWFTRNVLFHDIIDM